MLVVVTFVVAVKTLAVSSTTFLGTLSTTAEAAAMVGEGSTSALSRPSSFLTTSGEAFMDQSGNMVHGGGGKGGIISTAEDFEEEQENQETSAEDAEYHATMQKMGTDISRLDHLFGCRAQQDRKADAASIHIQAAGRRFLCCRRYQKGRQALAQWQKRNESGLCRNVVAPFLFHGGLLGYESLICLLELDVLRLMNPLLLAEGGQLRLNFLDSPMHLELQLAHLVCLHTCKLVRLCSCNPHRHKDECLWAEICSAGMVLLGHVLALHEAVLKGQGSDSFMTCSSEMA